VGESRIPIAIVGNGGAAAEAVIALRKHGYAGSIHVFADNEEAPFNPMLGTYVVSGAIPLERAFPFGGKEQFYGGYGVTAHLGSPVEHLDAGRRILRTGIGVSYEYERCLVASGARPSLPPVPGISEALSFDWDRRRVFTLRSLRDALDLRDAVGRLRSQGEGPVRAAVIGASLVGVKIAAFFRELGLGVCLIEREPHLLPLAAHPDCARMMEESLVADGYELRLGATLAGVDTEAERVRLTFAAPRSKAAADDSGDAAAPSAAGSGGAAATPALTDDFDLAVVCTGIRPSLGFLAPGTIETEAGIIVDEHMRSSVPTLYAAGDVAQGMNLLSGRHEIIALWASARYQGRAAGRRLAGAPGGYRGSIPSSISHVGRMLFASVGRFTDYDRLEAGQANGAFELKVWRDGRLVGVNLLDCCLSAGAMRQALQKEMVEAAAGSSTGTEASWISFNG
jgi:NADPH-dependent 2,4-dienoyl-CoA reductase/sulfur reductase-like enzyme